jgi:hypothetical protein
MLLRASATVSSINAVFLGGQEVSTEFGPAIAYDELVGTVIVGSKVLLNRTARLLDLGTGGYDFVMAVLDSPDSLDSAGAEHIVKLRYTPSQTAVAALESDPANAAIWDKRLDGTPVVVCQLHSQIAHCAAAAVVEGKHVVYVMTDAACLVASFSRLLRNLRSASVICATITAGQAVGGDFETVTIHSALLAARHLLGADVIIVGQGPGNAGTGTRYGFGGIEQAALLDTAAALGGHPVALIRTSSADGRPRHRGISHHTLTTMELVRSNCTIPVPAGMIAEAFESRHRVVEVVSLQGSFELLTRHKIRVASMGRSPSEDPEFFSAAAAAGKYAATMRILSERDRDEHQADL